MGNSVKLNSGRLIAVLAVLAMLMPSGAQAHAAQGQSSVGSPGQPFIQFSGRGDGTLPILWKETTGTNVTYDVVYSADNRQSWARAATGITATRCTSQQSGGHNHTNSVCYTINGPEGALTGQLDNNTTYFVSVRAHSGNASSGWITSDPFLPLETPRVTAYQMSCSSSGGYVLFASWAAFDAGTTSKMRYKIDNGNWVNLPAEDSNTPDHRKIQEAGAARWIEWMDQLPQQADEYNVTVQVQNSKTVGGETVTSAWAGPTIKAGTDTNVNRWLTRCPSAPANLRQTSTGTTSITVAWDAVTSPNPIVYDLRHRENGASTWTTTTGIENTTHTITGLVDTKAYDVEVRARLWSQSNSSNWTRRSHLVLKGLSASNITTSSATLTISRHAGAWYYERTTPSGGTCESVTAGTTADVSNLTAGTDYVFTAYSDSQCTNQIGAPAGFTTTSAVSNLNESGVTQLSFSSTHSGAQAFTTGSNTNGYTLKSVTTNMSFATPGRSPSVTVSLQLYTSSSNAPGSMITSLSSNSNVRSTDPGDYTYACSTTCTLSPSTTYFVVTNVPISNDPLNVDSFRWTETIQTNQTNMPSDSDWSIADTYRFGSPGSWPGSSNSTALKLQVAYRPVE